jgi:hypothetical protein
MADEKVYIPTVIEDTAFPQEIAVDTSISQTTGNETYSPQTTKEQGFPKKVIAVETIGAALNTKSRKILGEFEFVQMGAIQVGKYENGVTGDLRISPTGITARDKAGLNTFVIDAENGDATFKGTLQAGTLVGGDNTVIIDEDSGHGRILFMDGDKVAILLGWGDF